MDVFILQTALDLRSGSLDATGGCRGTVKKPGNSRSTKWRSRALRRKESRNSYLWAHLFAQESVSGRERCLVAGRARRFTGNQFRLHSDFLPRFERALNPTEQTFTGDSAEFLERLMYGGEPWQRKSCGFDVIEADDRHICGNAQIGILQSADRADCGDIVKGHERRKRLGSRKKLLHDRIAEFRRRYVSIERDCQFRTYCNSQLLRNRLKPLPAHIGIGTERLPAHEGNIAVSQGVQMHKRQFRGAVVIEGNVGDALDAAMTGNGDDGNRNRMIEERINGDDALGAAADEHPGVFLDQFRLMAMVRGEVEVSCLDEIVADSAHYLRVVSIAQFRYEDADCLRLAAAKRTGQQVGMIIQLARSSLDAIAGSLRNRPAGHVVKNDGNRRRIQAKVSCELFEAYRLLWLFALFAVSWLIHPLRPDQFACVTRKVILYVHACIQRNGADNREFIG